MWRKDGGGRAPIVLQRIFRRGFGPKRRDTEVRAEIRFAGESANPFLWIGESLPRGGKDIRSITVRRGEVDKITAAITEGLRRIEDEDFGEPGPAPEPARPPRGPRPVATVGPATPPWTGPDQFAGEDFDEFEGGRRP